MCGIVGSIGNLNSVDVVLQGLKRLEYRGYDSCGISYFKDNELKTYKSINKVQSLFDNVTTSSSISLGHTRWATHGKVVVNNSHPHTSNDNKVTLVHNGVIENYEELKDTYVKDINLKSETDSEIILEVFNYFYNLHNDINKAFTSFIKEVKGSYALIIFHEDFSDKLFVLKNKSPLLIGKGEEFYTISSDPSAVIDNTNLFHQLEDKTYAVLSSNDATLYNKDGDVIDFDFNTIDIDFEVPSTKDYDTYLLKEIEEQPNVLRNIIDFYKEYQFDEELLSTLKNSKTIYIIACGTSYNAGLICKTIIEKKLNIPVLVEIASEFGYTNPIIDKNSTFIFLSQSGETADSMLVFNQVINKYPVIAITNSRGSQMDRNANYSLLLYAGLEVSVASTKAYSSQIAVLSILAYKCNNNDTIFDELESLIIAQQKVIADQHIFEKLALEIKDEKSIFCLGRLRDYYQAMEASLKLKEVSYINVNAFASGELKHGPISLIEPGTKVVSIITQEDIAANSRSNGDEVRSRGAIVYTFSATKVAHKDDYYVVDYNGDYDLIPIVSIVPHQLLSYYTTLHLGYDVDMPRNLAKSVTVE